MSENKLLLASSSPRRRELLTTLGVDFLCQPADIDESVRPGELAQDYVQRMAMEKATVVVAGKSGPEYAVLGADTIVVVDGDILAKPKNLSDGHAILSRLSGRSHTVTTAICLQTENTLTQRSVETTVFFIPLSRAVCEAYLASDEPWDKAGSYGIQGLGGAFVRGIRGSYSNVVGLPLTETWELLAQHGFTTALGPASE